MSAALRPLTLLGLAFVAAFPAGGASMERAHGAGVVTCTHGFAYGLIFVTSARNMSCAAAVREEKTTDGHSLRHTKHGFSCHPLDANQMRWRCTNGSKAFRWSYGT
jgi:hypothetical protein